MFRIHKTWDWGVHNLQDVGQGSEFRRSDGPHSFAPVCTYADLFYDGCGHVRRLQSLGGSTLNWYSAPKTFSGLVLGPRIQSKHADVGTGGYVTVRVYNVL